LHVVRFWMNGFRQHFVHAGSARWATRDATRSLLISTERRSVRRIVDDRRLVGSPPSNPGHKRGHMGGPRRAARRRSQAGRTHRSTVGPVAPVGP
jgi:hypothetical protein